MNKKTLKFLALCGLPVLLIGYENCGNVKFSQVPNLLGNNNGTAIKTLKTLQPAFAVRGLNCMACHGLIGSNVITDFGYGSANFFPLFAAGPGGDNGRSAFDDIESGWQNLQMTGTLHVPKLNLTVAQAQAQYGINTATSLAQIIQMPNLGGNVTSMVSGITPVAGAPTVIEDASITITYPSQGEILNLLPSNLRALPIVAAAINVKGLSPSSMNGFVSDPTNSYITNSGPVSCYGDVIIKGPLFLNNLSVLTDAGGCRLYAANTVFIQGPINYPNGNGSNLQITSAMAIIMGLSTNQMGALPTATASSPYGQIRSPSEFMPSILTVGGVSPRFGEPLDIEYNPSGGSINGIPGSQYFDNIVLDGLKIGGALVDAGEPAAINNLVAGESIVTETGSGVGSYGGKRVAINYAGLLLNAPHVHSRYGGNFQGVVVADVTMLARNPTIVGAIEQFHFDPLFNTAPSILPALTTDILDVH